MPSIRPFLRNSRTSAGWPNASATASALEQASNPPPPSHGCQLPGGRRTAAAAAAASCPSLTPRISCGFENSPIEPLRSDQLPERCEAAPAQSIVEAVIVFEDAVDPVARPGVSLDRLIYGLSFAGRRGTKESEHHLLLGCCNPSVDQLADVV